MNEWSILIDGNREIIKVVPSIQFLVWFRFVRFRLLYLSSFVLIVVVVQFLRFFFVSLFLFLPFSLFLSFSIYFMLFCIVVLLWDSYTQHVIVVVVVVQTYCHMCVRLHFFFYFVHIYIECVLERQFSPILLYIHRIVNID